MNRKKYRIIIAKVLVFALVVCGDELEMPAGGWFYKAHS